MRDWYDDFWDKYVCKETEHKKTERSVAEPVSDSKVIVDLLKIYEQMTQEAGANHPEAK